MSKLDEKLSKEKCEDTLYGELLTAKLKKLPYHHWLPAKHDTDTIMFNYMCIDCAPEKKSQSFSLVIYYCTAIAKHTYAIPLQHTH